MSEALRLSGYREPLGLWVREASRIPDAPALRVRDIVFSSRGDRVRGRVLLPADGAGPWPLVIHQPGGAGATRDAMAAAWEDWGLADAALVSIDLPLHGSRADQKLLALVPAEPDAAEPWRRALADEFTRQAVIDLERTLDALGALEWIDRDRVVYVGFGLGARIGSAFCALDARVGAAALAMSDAGPATPRAAAEDWVGRIAPRPTLLLDPELQGAVAPALREFLARTVRGE